MALPFVPHAARHQTRRLLMLQEGRMKPATEILWSAACALTPEEHWHHPIKGPAPWCASLAISDAGDTLGHGWDASMTARRYLCRVINKQGTLDAIYAWNDAQKRTHAEVLDALYRAAELSEAS